MKLRSKDVLGLDGMSREEISLVLDTAEGLREILSRKVKKVPTLRGKTVCTLFYEPSTRTRSSFELACKYLSADTLNLTVAQSSVKKGETLKDTAATLEAMGVDMVIMRHGISGSCHLLARILKASVINAGDGTHQHPTQALLDMLTIRDHKCNLEGLKVAIIGDVLHSRVARSNTWGLISMGAEVYLSGPPTLVPPELREMGARVVRLEEALDQADVVYVLRVQKERQDGGFFPSTREYARFWGIDDARFALAKPDALVMHPGPMNRGVEITSGVADCPRSTVLQQVTNGVAVRMALLYLLLGGDEE